MIVAVVKLVSLRCHSGVSHDYIGIIVQPEMNLVSSVRALVNYEFVVVIECIRILMANIFESTALYIISVINPPLRVGIVMTIVVTILSFVMSNIKKD